MRKSAGFFALILVLALAGSAAVWIQSRSLSALRTYSGLPDPGGAGQTLVAGDPQSAGHRPISPLSGSVLLVIVGRLPEESSWRLGTLQMLRTKGADAVLNSPAPNYSPATWLTALSGAAAESHGALLPGEAPEQPPQTVISQIRAATLYAAAAGPPGFLAATGAAENDGTPRDAAAVQVLPPREPVTQDSINQIIGLWRTRPSLMVVYLPDLDLPGLGDRRSPEFLDALSRVDSILAQILEAVDLRRSTILVTSDSGARIPLVAAGRGIVPGTKSELRHKDLAPTIAAILGLPFPELSSGVPAASLLEIGSATDRIIAERLDKIQERRRTRLESLKPPAPEGAPASPTLNDALAVSAELEAAVEQTAASARLANARQRLPLAAGATFMLILAISATLFTRRHRRAVVIGTLVYLVLFNTMLMGPWKFGPFSREHSLTYSLPSFEPHSSLTAFSRQRLLESAVAAALAAAVTGFLAARGSNQRISKQDRLRAGKAGLWMALFTLSILGLPAAWAYLIDGLKYSEYLPDPDRVWTLHLILLQATALGFGGPLWAKIAAGASRLAR